LDGQAIRQARLLAMNSGIDLSKVPSLPNEHEDVEPETTHPGFVETQIKNSRKNLDWLSPRSLIRAFGSLPVVVS